MPKKNQDIIFYKSEGDKYFERNGPRINKSILKAVKFLKPKSNSNIFEVGCGCGSTLKKINTIFKSNVFGLDTSQKAINYATKKNNLKNMFHNTFMSFKTKKKFDIIITGGFLYVTPDHLLKKTIKKIFQLMKNNSYLIVWDYDTPFSYNNNYKYDKNLKSYKRDLLKEINKIDKKNYIDAKIAISKDYYTKDKKNKYITNYLSRRRVHFLRSMYDCIISTSKSINDDNSILDCRIEGLEHKSPDLIIIDRKLKLKKNLKLFNKKIKRKIYLVTTSDKKEKLLFFRKKGLKIIKLKSLNNYKDYLFFFTYLNKLGFSRIFIETGLSFLNFLINNKLINNMYIFQSNDKIKRFGINYNSIYLIKKMKLKNKINVNLFNNKLYKVNLK